MIDKKLKLLIDSIGVIVSSVGIILLCTNEMYIIASLILLIFFIASGFLIFHLRQAPFKWISFIYQYSFENISGSKVSVIKRKVGIPLEKNIDKLEDRKTSGSGIIKNFMSNIGRITETVDEGGTITSICILDAPLEIGEEFTHELSYQGENCFSENIESLTIDNSVKCKEMGLVVKFHRNRMPININAYKIRNSSKFCNNDLKKSDTTFTLISKNPKRGERLLLKWEW